MWGSWKRAAPIAVGVLSGMLLATTSPARATVPDAIRELGEACKSGASVSLQGAFDSAFLRWAAGAKIDGNAFLTRNETEFLLSFEDEALRLEARRLYNGCIRIGFQQIAQVGIVRTASLDGGTIDLTDQVYAFENTLLEGEETDKLVKFSVGGPCVAKLEIQNPNRFLAYAEVLTPGGTRIWRDGSNRDARYQVTLARGDWQVRFFTDRGRAGIISGRIVVECAGPG